MKYETKGGVHCSVVGCKNGSVRCKGTGIRFFSFPSRNAEIRELWIQAVKRINADGSDWNPTKWSRVCSEHLIDGQWSPTHNHPSYVLSIFKTKHVREGKESDVARIKRFKRQQKQQKVQASKEQANNIVLLTDELIHFESFQKCI